MQALKKIIIRKHSIKNLQGTEIWRRVSYWKLTRL